MANIIDIKQAPAKVKAIMVTYTDKPTPELDVIVVTQYGATKQRVHLRKEIEHCLDVDFILDEAKCWVNKVFLGD